MWTIEELIEQYRPTLDLGGGHWGKFAGWHPDRGLNPQYAHLPDVEKHSLIHIHPRPDGQGYCVGAITLDSEAAREISPNRPRWKVESLEPLTLSPSLLCKACNSHGYIKQGKWVDC